MSLTVPVQDAGLRDDGMARRIRLGYRMVGFGFVSGLLWLALADISGAVVAAGQVVVETDVKKMQHPSGGVVEKVFVQNGDRVRQGDLLVRLDETQARATLAQVTSQLAQLTGRAARLVAERDNRDTLVLSADFTSLHADAAAIARGEARLLTESRAERRQTIQQLEERFGQSRREIEGAQAQFGAKTREHGFISVELKGVKALYEKNLIPLMRLSALQRDTARLEGEMGALTASMARSEGQIAEIKVQILNIEQKVKTDAMKELREVEGSIAQLNEKRVAAQDILNRIELRAPVAGTVHELALHTVGGVVAPGEVLMQLVPVSDKLFVEVRLAPPDIDQVQRGQHAVLRFSAFNQRTTPEVKGLVSRIAPDATREPQTNQSYYAARLVLDEGEASKLAGLTLIPGMPVEAFIETGKRSALSYLMKPFTDSMHRAFRER
jgi:HlyD family secretion protein